MRQAGLRSSQLMLAFDFSKSNVWSGLQTYRRSLHDTAQETPYEKVCRLMLPVIANFDDDGVIPALRFGCRDTKDRTVAPLSPLAHTPECKGLGEVLRQYREAVNLVRLSGPTTLAPVIRYAIQVVRLSHEYHILLILTDGDPVSASLDVDAVVEASNYPISIIVVGLGDGPFPVFESFDEHIPHRRFDNFQFVNFSALEREYHSSDRADLILAIRLFEEIPMQYQKICEHGLL